MSASNLRQFRLRWTGDGLAFRGGPDGRDEIGIDSAGEIGPSPMELLLGSVAGCMAIDILMILEKSRLSVESLEFNAVGTRAETAPKRFERIELECHVVGPSEEDEAKIQRAVDLSKDKYCSVLHTLDPELDFVATVRRG